MDKAGGSPTISIIAAMTADRVMGSGGSLPWHIPEEMALFRNLTMGGALVMGRRTFESIGAPLPGRETIVISSTMTEREGVQVVRGLDDALQQACATGRPVFIIGGAEVFRQALERDLADSLCISWIHTDYPGEVLFPSFDPHSWLLQEERRYHSFTFCRYARRR